MTKAIEHAEELFEKLLEIRACVTYSLAYEEILGNRPQRWTQANANQVLQVAVRTEPRQVNGLRISLDGLIVNGRTREPGRGHFLVADYTLADWRKALGGCRLLDRL